MRPAFHCPNGGIGRRVGLKIQCPLKTCRFEPGFGHRDRSAGNFLLRPVFFLTLSLFSISRFLLPPSIPVPSPFLAFIPLPLTCPPLLPLHPRVFSISPVPTISSLHSLHCFPISPHYQKSPVPPFIPFPPHLGTNSALSVPAKSFPPHPGTNSALSVPTKSFPPHLGTNSALFVPKSREGKIRQRKGGETN